MEKQKTLVPWFQRGDIGGMTYSITNNIVNYLIVIATLSGVLEWPDKIVYGYVIPGMSIGLLCSGVYYAYMGRRLSRKEGRADVTALPSGVSTPAMFVMLYGVIMPLHYALNDAELAWSAAVAACRCSASALLSFRLLLSGYSPACFRLSSIAKSTSSPGPKGLRLTE